MIFSINNSLHCSTDFFMRAVQLYRADTYHLDMSYTHRKRTDATARYGKQMVETGVRQCDAGCSQVFISAHRKIKLTKKNLITRAT